MSAAADLPCLAERVLLDLPAESSVTPSPAPPGESVTEFIARHLAVTPAGKRSAVVTVDDVGTGTASFTYADLVGMMQKLREPRLATLGAPAYTWADYSVAVAAPVGASISVSAAAVPWSASFRDESFRDESFRADLTPQKCDAPLMGWKIARLQAENVNGTVKIRFGGVGMGEPYDAVAEAHCVSPLRAPRDHLAPDPDCGCGFYVLAHPLGHPATDGIIGGYFARTALLRVEVWGRVVEHAPVTWHESVLTTAAGMPIKKAVTGEPTGWRAQHQRVLDVYLDPICGVCMRRCDPATLNIAVGWCHDLDVKAMCPSCLDRRLYRLKAAQRPGEHAGRAMIDAVLTVDQLAAELGVPVRWAAVTGEP